LTVAQYIAGDLASDELKFHNPLYNQILAEAEAHSVEADFKAESYFAHHPDIEISKLATMMIVNRYQISQSMKTKTTDEMLSEQVEHLIGDFRMDYLEVLLQDLMQQIRKVGSDMELLKPIMTRYREVKTIRDALAKKLGNNIIV
ncbi:MAG TPA: DNA primase, partial [Xylanibacter oryzae]|nr:DNA primase [Xylanibacter oryzae]